MRSESEFSLLIKKTITQSNITGLTQRWQLLHNNKYQSTVKDSVGKFIQREQMYLQTSSPKLVFPIEMEGD